MLGVLLLLATLYLCLRPTAPEPPSLPNLDKLQHLTAWFVLTAWFGALIQRRHLAWVVLGALALGGAIEVAQGAMDLGRTADLRDVLANAVGVAAGLGLSLASRESLFQRIERWLAPT